MKIYLSTRVTKNAMIILTKRWIRRVIRMGRLNETESRPNRKISVFGHCPSVITDRDNSNMYVTTYFRLHKRKISLKSIYVYVVGLG